MNRGTVVANFSNPNRILGLQLRPRDPLDAIDLFVRNQQECATRLGMGGLAASDRARLGAAMPIIMDAWQTFMEGRHLTPNQFVATASLTGPVRQYPLVVNGNCALIHEHADVVSVIAQMAVEEALARRESRKDRRECLECGSPVPLSFRSNRRLCSGNCKIARKRRADRDRARARRSS